MKAVFIKLFMLFTCFCLSHQLTAQRTYQQGYLLTNKQDTLRGYLLNEQDKELSYTVQFRPDLSSPAKRYSATELSGFGYSESGKIFRKFTVANSSSANDSIAVFAKELETGKVDLYTFKNLKNELEFIVQNNETGQLVHLKKSENKVIKDENNKHFSYEDKRYIGQLKLITGNKGAQSEKLDNLKYKHNSIVNYVNVYNQSYQKEYPVSHYNPPVFVTYDILIGHSVKEHYRGSYLSVAVIRNSMNFEKNGNFSLYHSVSLHYGHKSLFQSIESSNPDWEHNLRIVPVGIKYQANSKYFTPYVRGGIGVDVRFDPRSFKPFPLPFIHLTFGSKIKIGSQNILAEIAPFQRGMKMSLGYSF